MSQLIRLLMGTQVNPLFARALRASPITLRLAAIRPLAARPG